MDLRIVRGYLSLVMEKSTFMLFTITKVREYFKYCFAANNKTLGFCFFSYERTHQFLFICVFELFVSVNQLC